MISQGLLAKVLPANTVSSLHGFQQRLLKADDVAFGETERQHVATRGFRFVNARIRFLQCRRQGAKPRLRVDLRVRIPKMRRLATRSNTSSRCIDTVAFQKSRSRITGRIDNAQSTVAEIADVARDDATAA